MQLSPRPAPALQRSVSRRCSVAVRAIASPVPVSSPSHYEVLGVSYAATPRELKQAFRAKSKEVHPDVSKEAHAAERFMQAKAAYETLSSEDARRAYDDALAFARLSALSSGPQSAQLPIVHSSYSSTGYSSPYTTTSYSSSNIPPSWGPSAHATSSSAAASAESDDGFVSCSDSDPYVEECYADMAAAAAAAAATPSYTYTCTTASAPSSSYASTSRPLSSARAAAAAAAASASAAASNSSPAQAANPRARNSSPAALRNTMAALLKEARFWSRKVERTLGGANNSGPATAAASSASAAKAIPNPASASTPSPAAAAAAPTAAPRSRPAVFKNVRSDADYDVGEAAAWLYYAPAGRAASLAMAAKAARNGGGGTTAPPLSPLRRRY